MKWISRSMILIGLMLPAACAVGPDYKRPSAPVPASYKEASGEWRQAAPQDDKDRGAWWSVYKDPVLDDLEKQVTISNQNLKAAEAAYREANAVAEETRSTLFPSLTVNSSTGRQGGPMPTPASSNTLYATATWVPDVWGRIRRGLESDKANAEASAADLASARLSMQAALATNYFDLRAQDELKHLLDAIAESDRKALQILQSQYNTGTAAAADIHMAQAQLNNAKAQAINTGVRRAQLEHAIAVLIGKPPAAFSLPAGKFDDDLPDIQSDLPSALLERRPDIASAERRVASANAQIGVATAAWFPDFMISGSSGFASMGKLLAASNYFWAVGPALAETVFDAGAREARIKEKRAAYDQNVALYRQAVLSAFQQLEDNLSSLRLLALQRKVQDAAVSHARMAEQLSIDQYTNGTGTYNGVLLAQIARLNNEQSLLMVRQGRLDASVALIQALGGGWDASELIGRAAPQAH